MDFYRQLGIMSQFELSWFEEKLSETFTFYRASKDYIWDYWYNFEDMKYSDKNEWPGRNLHWVQPGEDLAGLTSRFDYGGWGSHSVIVNSIDIILMLPLLYAFTYILKGLANANKYSQRFERLYLRFKEQFWHNAIVFTYTKLFFASWVNFHVMRDDTWWEFFTSFMAVYVFLTCVIFYGWYLWVAWMCLRKTNPGRPKVFIKKLFLWQDRYNDHRSYHEHEMPNNWYIKHFMKDINIKKPLACFHYVVFFTKRSILCILFISYRNDPYNMLIWLLCYQLGSFLWVCLVRPYKTTAVNRVAIWAEMCLLAIVILLFPFAYKWTTFEQVTQFAKWNFSLIFILLLIMICISIF